MGQAMRAVAARRAGGVRLSEFPLPCPFEDLFPAVAEERLPVILDSSRRDGRLGRWSFAAFDPLLFLTSNGRRTSVSGRDGETVLSGSPFRALRHVLNRWSFERTVEAPPFLGGVVGYFSYDLKQHIERLPDTATHDIPLPEMAFGVYPSVLGHEHETGRTVLASNDLRGRSARGARAAEGAWRARWEGVVRRAAGPPPAPDRRAPGVRRLVSTFRRSDYLAAVRRALDYIAAGDIFQVNLSQRFSAPYAGRPYHLYERLRRTNPAPFGAYLAYPFGAVLSSSPERFLKVADGHVETRPIKGTRPRTGDPALDEAASRDLLASPKDNAELAMIVDLERNDLGRVCRYGSVRVTEPRVLETYARVFHLVATVEGDLHPRYDLVDLVKAAFPGGSVTGAPKIRAMEIIDELEPTARSVYTGAIGYIGLDGTCDLNIAIRTILVAQGVAHAQVGGGIVADSVSEAEFQETLDKGQALFAALGLEAGA